MSDGRDNLNSLPEWVRFATIALNHFRHYAEPGFIAMARRYDLNLIGQRRGSIICIANDNGALFYGDKGLNV